MARGSGLTLKHTHTRRHTHTHTTFIQQSSSAMETSMPGLLHHHHHTQSGLHLLQLGLQRVCVHVSEYVFLCGWDHVCPCVCLCVWGGTWLCTLRTRSQRKWKLCRASHTETSSTILELCWLFASCTAGKTAQEFTQMHTSLPHDINPHWESK